MTSKMLARAVLVRLVSWPLRVMCAGMLLQVAAVLSVAEALEARAPASKKWDGRQHK